MPAKLNQLSLKRLVGVHPDLVRIVHRAHELSPVPFQITEGLRSLARQRDLVKQGASRTLNSRHLTGHAVDVVAYVGNRISWEAPLYYRIADAFKAAARECGHPVEWGGDWKGFFDGPHFQLPWSTHPSASMSAGRAEARAARMIRPGQQGDDVRALQAMLRDEVAPDLAVDGDYGPQTYAAVKALQEALGVKVDGIVGPKTRAALDRARKDFPVKAPPVGTARFRACVAHVFDDEGGYVNHPADKGGPTNMGITQATLSEWRGAPVTAADVKKLKRAEAEQIYHAKYWLPVFGDVAGEDLPAGVDYAIFDFVVNSGQARAAEIIQAALALPVTHKFDRATYAALRAGNPWSLVPVICGARMAYLAAHPNWGAFGGGWTNRVNKVLERAEAMLGQRPERQAA